jgi:ketosteroid isomerase-like protein
MTVTVLMLMGMLLTPQAPSAASADTTEQAVRAAEAARIQAFVSNDVPTLERLLADDLTYTHSSGLMDGKAQLIDALRSGRTRYLSMTPDDVKVRIYGDVAVLTGRMAVRVNNNGQALDLQLRFTSAYVRHAGAWQFVAWQSTRVPPPTTP